MAEWSTLSDEEVARLVDQAVLRDAEAFGKLYDIHLEPIYRYLYYRLGNQTEAEDLCEHVFLKAWEAIDRFRWQGKPFAAWLYRLAHNALVDHIRTRKVTAPLDDHVNLVKAGSESWDLARLDADELAQAITKLTTEQQQVIVLKFVQGLENHEIAQIMNKREGAIRALQLRGLQALRRIISAEAQT